MDPALTKKLADLGQPVAGGNNTPLLLDDRRQTWWVEEGKVEIFAVTDPDGPRTHLCTALAGHLLFGIAPREPREDPLQLLAVGLPDSQIRQIGLDQIGQLARDPDNIPALAAAVDAWVRLLFQNLRREVPPKVFQDLRSGAETTLDSESPVGRPVKGVSWLRHLSGRTHFRGRAELPIEPTPYLLPVSEETWIVADGQANVSCVETGILLRGGTVWEGLEHFHDLYLDVLRLWIDEGEEEERQRLGRKVERDRGTLRSAYSQLASVLGEVPTAGPDMDTANKWVASCRLVGESQGLEVNGPPDLDPNSGPGVMVSRIASVSRLRYRRVMLRGPWWKRDNGPLVAMQGGEGKTPPEPVALLPTSANSYEMVKGGVREEVGDEQAEALHGIGYMFYPPLPEGEVGKLDILRAAFRERRTDLLTIVLMGIGSGLLALLIPILTGQIFGNVIPAADRPQLLQMTIALLASALAAAAFQVTRSIAVLRLGGKFDGNVQAAVWDRLLSLPVGFFRRFTVGDLVERSMGIDAIRELTMGHVTTTLLAGVFSLLSFALLFYFSWRLALLATVLTLVMIGITVLLAYMQLRHQRALFLIQGKIASLLFGLIHGISKLRVAAAEPRAYSRWAERFTEQREHAVAAQRVANMQAAFNSLFEILSLAAMFAMVGFSAQIDLSLSRFLAFNAAYGQFQAAFLSITAIFPALVNMVPIWERLQPILKTRAEVDTGQLDAGELRGEIELSHVSFRYQADGPLILDDVSLRARPGEFIALVGPSGSGKSTTLRLILGFEQPQSGSIYFDGQDLPSLDVQSVRRQIGVVLQNSRPMAGDIFTNIVGSSFHTQDDAWEAARMAGLAEDIEAMPMGMHTVISEGASTLSGGQRQRLMIARAIVGRPRIILFDEATSALDNRTQEVVSRSLEGLEATRVVVAHRLSTILNADRIYVLDKGRVVEEGTYDELVAQGGVFARLAARQIA